MNSYTLYLMRREDTALFQEAAVELHHHLPPLLKMGEKTLLTEAQVSSLLSMVGETMAGRPAKLDLKTFAPVPEPDLFGPNGE